MQVATAVVKAVVDAKRHLVRVPLTKSSSFPHRIDGLFGAAKVMLRPAAEGTGVIAGGAVRIVLEMAGVKNGFGKQLGTDNPLNNARATIEGLKTMKTYRQVADERGVPIEWLLQTEKRGMSSVHWLTALTRCAIFSGATILTWHLHFAPVQKRLQRSVLLCCARTGPSFPCLKALLRVACAIESQSPVPDCMQCAEIIHLAVTAAQREICRSCALCQQIACVLQSYVSACTRIMKQAEVRTIHAALKPVVNHKV